MKYCRDKINTVLAMFDPEDIPYINPDIKIDKNINVNKKQKQKVKKVGEVVYDRSRK